MEGFYTKNLASAHLFARPAHMAAPSYNNAMPGKLNLKGGLPSTAKKCAITATKCL